MCSGLYVLGPGHGVVPTDGDQEVLEKVETESLLALVGTSEAIQVLPRIVSIKKQINLFIVEESIVAVQDPVEWGLDVVDSELELLASLKYLFLRSLFILLSYILIVSDRTFVFLSRSLFVASS